MKVTIIVPSLNELEGLKTYLPQIKREWYDQIIVLIGRPTKDNSIGWCITNGYNVFMGEENLWEGYTNLFKSGCVLGDVVVTLSPDGNSVIDAIPKLIDKINEGYDLVIASRYLNRNKSKDDTKLTAIGNGVLTELVNIGNDFRYTDALVMYRAYRKDIIIKLGLTSNYNWLQKKLIKMTGLYSYEPSMAVRAMKAKLKIAEIYADEPPANRERRQNTFVHGLAILTQVLMERVWNPKN
jgi:glycosyltransferase involved in cell wall biosynthesis